jgi:hypothetical protein
MEQLILRDVELTNFSSAIIRGYNASDNVGTLTVENVIADNISYSGTYALFHMKDGGVIDNYDIKNSTFYNFKNGVIQQQASSSNTKYTQTVNFENCTFYNFGQDKYFADFKSQSGGTFTLKNCILGLVQNTGKFRGMQGSFGTYSASQTFTTTDYGTVSGALKNVISTGKTSDELFEDAEGGNFRVTDATYAASGDPRWN